MNVKRGFRLLAMTIASTALALAAAATPAAASTSAGYWDDFYKSCDANVFISDSLIGSPGKIEAWGGFSCPYEQAWFGIMQLKISNGNSTVAWTQKGFNPTRTEHIELTTTNSPGTQNWKATLWLSLPGTTDVLLSTGVIPS